MTPAAILSPAVHDFVEGGAGDERTLAANLAAFAQVRLLPRVLSAVTRPDPAVEIFGRRWTAPIGIAPLAYHGLADAGGEVTTVRAAARAGLPMIVPTMAGCTLEDVARRAQAPLWWQVYAFRDRRITADLVRRATDAGYEAIVLTVDVPRLGDRRRDARNNFRLPPDIRPVNLDGYGLRTSPRDPSGHSREEFDPALDWSVVEWIRTLTPLPVLVKGVLHPDDAVLAVDSGVSGIIVSNHGGRQFDGAVASLTALPTVVDAVAGRCPVFLDGGVRRGVDVLTARALGADAVFVGRPVLRALADGGEQAVFTLLTELRTQYEEALLFAGCADSASADRSLVHGTEPSALRVPATPPAPSAPGDSAGLPLAGLHASVADPLLDTMNFLNEITSRFPDAISFAPGRPWDEDFAIEDVLDDVRRYVRHRAADEEDERRVELGLLQYAPAAGVIRDLIADTLAADEGVHVAPESVVVTVGCQEAMLLALRTLFADERDVLGVPSPCYVGVSGAARLLDIPVVAIPEGEDGVSAEAVERAVETERLNGRRLRAVYVIPDAANPSGVTMSRESRTSLLALAQRHDFLVIEDSPYRDFAGVGHRASLKALDAGRRVVQLGSYAKTAYPGLRVGYVVADQTVIHPDGGRSLLAEQIAKVKSMVTVATPGLAQAAIGGFLLRGARRHERTSRAAERYRLVFDRALRELETCFPAELRGRLGVSWNRPAGGFFMTMQVPFPADEAALLRSAVDYGVLWTPMSYFHHEKGGAYGIRLSLSSLDPDTAADGIRRLSRFILNTITSKEDSR